MICPNCHGNIPNHSKFCTLCGARITHPASPAPDPLQKITNRFSFHHFDLRSLMTFEAVLWIFPFLMLFFSPVESYENTGGLLIVLIDQGRYLNTGVKVFLWVIAVLTILMVVIGFLQVFRTLKNRTIVDYAIFGVPVSLFYILFSSLIFSMISAAGIFGIILKTSLFGYLVRIASWILLAAHCCQIWMMATRHRRLP